MLSVCSVIFLENKVVKRHDRFTRAGCNANGCASVIYGFRIIEYAGYSLEITVLINMSNLMLLIDLYRQRKALLQCKAAQRLAYRTALAHLAKIDLYSVIHKRKSKHGLTVRVVKEYPVSLSLGYILGEIELCGEVNEILKICSGVDGKAYGSLGGLGIKVKHAARNGSSAVHGKICIGTVELMNVRGATGLYRFIEGEYLLFNLDVIKGKLLRSAKRGNVKLLHTVLISVLIH